MNSREYNSKVKFLTVENRRYSDEFVPLPPEQWPEWNGASMVERVLRNNRFLVQVILAEKGVRRLSICRTMIGRDGRWLDGITWDELQGIKNAVGFGGYDAVEIYPKANDVVNVANMRHLWVVEAGVPFAWRGM